MPGGNSNFHTSIHPDDLSQDSDRAEQRSLAVVLVHRLLDLPSVDLSPPTTATRLPDTATIGFATLNGKSPHPCPAGNSAGSSVAETVAVPNVSV